MHSTSLFVAKSSNFVSTHGHILKKTNDHESSCWVGIPGNLKHLIESLNMFLSNKYNTETKDPYLDEVTQEGQGTLTHIWGFISAAL